MTPPYFTRSPQHQVRLTRRLQRDMELAEARSWYEFYEALGEKNDVGPFRDVLVASIPEIDKLIFNRVVGLGMGSMVLDSKIEDLITYYEGRGVKRFMVQLSPFVIPDNTDLMLKRRRFVYQNDWAKLIWRVTDQIEEIKVSCEITQVKEGEEDLYADVMLEALDWSDLLRPALKNSIHKEGFFHYLAWADGKAIAGGSTFITKSFATLKLGATIPAYRKNGIHQLLLQRKIKDAMDMGCEWITAETAHMADGSTNSANRNLRRMGFTEAYKRSNYVYTF